MIDLEFYSEPLVRFTIAEIEILMIVVNVVQNMWLVVVKFSTYYVFILYVVCAFLHVRLYSNVMKEYWLVRS